MQNTIALKTQDFLGSALSKYTHLRITDTTEIPEPVPVIRINGEQISTEGNITTISGASKSGKSAFSSVLLAGAIAQGEYDGFPDIEITPAGKNAVIHFDTEQARYKHQKNLKSTLKRARVDGCPENLLSYNIREEEIERYCTITKEIVEGAFLKFGGIHLIVIDGGADYIRDVNEPSQSNTLVKFFEDLAIQYETPVIIIVHVNPNSDKERGHFGSQLQRKSESVLTIKNQEDISFLEPKFLRGAGKGDIKLLQFLYDKEKGYHVYCGVRKPDEGGAKDELRLEKIKMIAKTVFSDQESYSYNEAIDKIMKESGKGITTTKGLFREMNAHELIIQGNDRNWRLK